MRGIIKVVQNAQLLLMSTSVSALYRATVTLSTTEQTARLSMSMIMSNYYF